MDGDDREMVAGRKVQEAPWSLFELEDNIIRRFAWATCQTDQSRFVLVKILLRVLRFFSLTNGSFWVLEHSQGKVN